MTMERIVQLRDYEYNNLVEKANLNEKHIDEKAQKLYKERGVAGIDIKLGYKNNDYESSFRFDCSAFVWYKDEKFYIPEQLRKRLGKILKDTMLSEMREAYGSSEKIRMSLERERKYSVIFHWVMFVTAVSGWVTFILYLCLS